jgi:predicted porin
VGRVSDAVDSLEGYANFINLFDTETAAANGIGGKNANSVRYDSPAFMGANLIATYSSDAVGTDGTTNSGNVVRTIGVTYASGPFAFGAAKGEANVNLATQKGEVSTVYARYDLGVADLRAQYTSDETAARVKYTTQEVSANIPLGAGLSAVVHFETANFNGTNGSSATAADYSQYGVLIRKDLSKRTHGYVGYRSLDREAAASTDTKLSVVGIAHSF